MELKSLTYTSLARLDLGAGDLVDIHQTARRLNALDGVTGMLIFNGSRFLQIIEGAEEAIDNLLGRLRRDGRHSALEVRDERIVAQRSFADWSMELVRVSAAYLEARDQIADALPPTIAPAVRNLVLRMAGEGATAPVALPS
jgi:FAD-dependent sensor of blue light